MTPLHDWENFYVIVGSSAGALIGLQFVVLALIAETPVVRGGAQASAAFSSPSVVHFALVLLLSALLSAPWKGLTTVALLWGFMGLGGVLYSFVVGRRLRSQTAYQPVLEDWLYHLWLPSLAYVALAASAGVAFSDAHVALFVVGAAALLLLFVGIHNAWDAVTYHVFVRRKGSENDGADPR